MTTAPDAAPEAGSGLFGDPLAGWSNDDILLTKPARAVLGARHLRSLRVLDWPELRAQFTRYEEPANRHARRDRGLGLGSASCAAAGLVLAGFAPLASLAAPYLGAAAALLCLAGAIFSGVHWLDRPAKARWLGNRFWTERMRALYFQTIINNLGLVAAAMRSDAALGEWKAARARALAALPTPDDLATRIGKLAGVVGEDEAWVLSDWALPPLSPELSEELDIVFTLLRSQRFDSQIAYTDRKLGDSLRAPRRRSQAVALGGQLLPAGAVIAAATAGVLLLVGQPGDGGAVRLALAVAAAATVAALALRMINDDLKLSEDAGRYAWYGAAVQRARARFDAGDLSEKLAALREMEVIAYRDLRAFVAAHWRGRYVP